MSTISVSNITTANGTELLSLATGNTLGSRVIVNPSASVVLASNSTTNTVVVNSTGSFFSGNVNVLSMLANGGLGTGGQVLTSGGSSANIYWTTISAPDTFNTNVTFNANATFNANITGNVTIQGGNLVVPTGNVNFDAGALFVDSVNARVGIGNTAPDAALTVGGAANVTGLSRFGGNVTMAGTLQTISGNVNFDAGSVFVDATNNRLGVGTTSPDATFTVTGQANVSANVRFGANVTVVGNLNIASTLGNTGYVELNSGVKVNWGVIAANSSTLGNATFSSAFATGPYAVTMTGANSLGNTCWSAGVNSTVVQVRSSNTSSTGGLVYYMAIGI